MGIRWSEPVPIPDLLKPGGKCGELLPPKTGVYRLKVLSGNKRYPSGTVVYIGKVGGGARKDRHLRRRIGEFIIAGMGFENPHSGGIRFWEEGDEHGLWVQDLGVEFFRSNDPLCDEIRAFDEFTKATGERTPFLNRVRPRTRCGEHK